MLSRERLKPIIGQGRKVVLFPDRDGVEKWKIKAEQLHCDKLMLDCKPVQEWWQEGDGEKADIADVVVRIMNERKPMTTIGEVKAAMPVASPLIDKLNLEITDEQRTD